MVENKRIACGCEEVFAKERVISGFYFLFILLNRMMMGRREEENEFYFM